MDFATIGKVGSYIQQKNISFAANYKIQTGQRVMDSNGRLQFSQSSMFEQINEATKKSADEVKTARLASIKSKLMSGRKLSDEEMNYLRENSEDLYKKAKHAEDAREELKAELKGARTKQEAREILNRAMVKASAEASAELAAYQSGGGAVSGAVNDATSTENISTTAENISGNEPSTQIGNTSDAGFNSTNDITEPANDTTSNEAITKQSILEKLIMTLRALEDEWMEYSNSDEYKDLPESFFDDEKVYRVAEVPSKKLFGMIASYRQAADNFNSGADSWTNITLQS